MDIPIGNVACGIIDDFTRLGGTGLSLTGGEVLTHPACGNLMSAEDRCALRKAVYRLGVRCKIT